MKIIKADSAGFCFGVSRAVRKTLDAAAQNPERNIFTYGPLIHNPTVERRLCSVGVGITEDISGLDDGSIVIIRSHGVGKSIYSQLESRRMEYVDATCPYVKSIQNKVEKYHKRGYTIVIVGDRQHPEVIGINGWCDNTALIVNSPAEAESLVAEGPICAVAQTTNINEHFERICDIIKGKFPDTVLFNTICSATSLRQTEARKISSEADAMIIVGGLASSNTKKLAQICSEHCKKVIQVETADELDPAELSWASVIGITAGASTPEQNIMEVVSKMENTNENLEKSLSDFKRLKVGDIVKGKIISVTENEVYIDVNYKSDGIIKKADYLLDLYSDLSTQAAAGDEVEAMVIDMNDGLGNVLLSKIKVDEIFAMQATEEKFNSKETVSGKIVKVVKGGLIVDIGFAKAFMPANQYAMRYVEDINALLGNEVEGRIIEFDKDRNKIIFSRRVILQEEYEVKKAEREAKKAESLASLSIGQVVSAPVKNITGFGIFLDLGGVDGFVHVSDLAWHRINKPEDFCKVGDILEAKVTEIDTEKGKVKLSVKDMTEEPWQVFLKSYKAGDIVEGTVKSITKFGAFLEIIPSVEGLIHISNLSYDKVESVESVLHVGETAKAKIIEIDNAKRKIGLSIKELTEPPKKKVEPNKLFYKEDANSTMEEAFKKYLK